MATVGLCMIVKNEEHVLKRCLDSFKAVADEIVIVDSSSDDDTVKEMEKYFEHKQTTNS